MRRSLPRVLDKLTQRGFLVERKLSLNLTIYVGLARVSRQACITDTGMTSGPNPAQAMASAPPAVLAANPIPHRQARLPGLAAEPEHNLLTPRGGVSIAAKRVVDG